MFKLIKDQFVGQLEKHGITRKSLETRNILDKNYKVIKGTIRETPDNDCAWLFELSAHYKDIFDIGANIGTTAMLMLYHEEVKNIILIDPNPKALSTAAENLIINNLSHKAKFINAFISDKIGDVIDFYTVGYGAAGSKFQEFAKSASKLNSTSKVSTLTVDYLVQDIEIVPEFVKIDVEGAEIEVLNGARELAKKAYTAFFVEIHSAEGLSIIDNSQLIIDWCNANGYFCWYLKTKTHLEIDSIKTRGRFHVLLLPKNKPFPEYLKNINESDHIGIINET